jgi:hypothetical protein
MTHNSRLQNRKTATGFVNYDDEAIRNYNGITLKREKNFSLNRENDAEAAAKAAAVGESR